MSESLRAFASGLARTRQTLVGRIVNALGAGGITSATWEEMEAQLIEADMGVAPARQVVGNLRSYITRTGVTSAATLHTQLVAELRGLLADPPPFALDGDPTVVLLVGVNGAGKTTTAAKLAQLARTRFGARPLLAACDTFRAAAVEQLQTWGTRLDLPVVSGAAGADPGAVLFDAVASARARGSNLVLADTAGRLHSKFNLMEELKKVQRVAGKASAGAPQHVLLVLDAVSGQNALAQAAAFKAAVGVTAVVITKLDSSARGGIVFAVQQALNLPVQFVGSGERLEDLETFSPDDYVARLLAAESQR